MHSQLVCGGIILCGGLSRRMGRDKAGLPFGPELMLPRIVRILADVVQPIVIVAAVGQKLPALPAQVRIARDTREARGPLQGLWDGLAEMSSDVEAAFVTPCDVPLLQPGFVQRLVERLNNCQIVAANVGGVSHPLPAVYRRSIREPVRVLLQADQLRLGQLLDQQPTCLLSASDFADVDPHLHSLRNLNDPEDYAAALAIAGLPCP